MSEAEDLKEITREAHAAIKDLRSLLKEAREVLDDLDVAAHINVKKHIDATVKRGLEDYSDQIKAATEGATDAVYQRFDTILSFLMGEQKGQKRKRDGDTVPEMLRQVQAGGYGDPNIDLSGISEPLSREVTGQ